MSSAVSLAKRSAILGFTRFASQAILFLSPMILVRLLSVAEYGKYREFILYATIAVSVLGFNATSSLPYFIPRYPDQAKRYTTQAVAFVLLATVAGITVIGVAGDFLRSKTNFDFVLALQAYIFVTANFDFLEMYWLAHKQVANVLYYSSARLMARLAVITVAAALTGRVEDVVWALILIESIRLLLVMWYGHRREMFSLRTSGASIRYQASYFLPLGAGSIVYLLNQNIAKFLVSSVAGVEALAMYVTGAFATPLVGIVRSAISDVIFPEMAQMKEGAGSASLRLWRRATVAYAVLLFPVAALCVLLAEEVITLLFTPDYAAAAPIFAVFAALIVVQCFDFHLPLRLLNQNRFYLVGNALALAVNLVLLVPSYKALGIAGPAMVLVLSQVVLTLYLAHRAMRGHAIGMAELADWGFIARVALAAALSAGPAGYVSTMLEADWSVIVVSGVVYGMTYLAATHLLGLWRVAAVRAFVEERRRRRRG